MVGLGGQRQDMEGSDLNGSDMVHGWAGDGSDMVLGEIQSGAGGEGGGEHGQRCGGRSRPVVAR